MIGPTFAKDLEAAGLLGLPFSWEKNGNITGRENLTPAQNTALDAVLAAHNPNAVIPNDEIDTDRLNAMLTEDGSVVRALAEVLFQVAKVQTPTLTKQQFINLLKSKMRTN